MARTALIPAAAYYRMSSDKQEASIGDQRTAVAEYAAANGYRIVAEYTDEGVSGWKDSRKGFRQLIADASAGAFAAVLCWDQDHFSRFDVLEANHYWYLLNKAGVHIATVAQGRLDFATLAGWLTASIAQHGKAEYCRDLARNTVRGLRRLQAEGKWHGHAPYGYRRGEDGRLAIEPIGAAIVRDVFRWRVQGLSYGVIAARLNERGVSTQTGVRWTRTVVSDMLARVSYRGHTPTGYRSRCKYEAVQPTPCIRENTHPAIIDAETWKAVRALDGEAPRRRAGTKGAELTGLLYCAHCGGRMHGHTQRHLRYYVCGTYLRSRVCEHRSLRQDTMFRLVCAKIRERFLGCDEQRIRARFAQRTSQFASPEAEQASLARQVEQIDRKLATAAERLVSVHESLVPSIEATMLALRERRAGLLAQQEVRAAKVRTIEQVLAAIRRLDDVLRSGKVHEVNALLHKLVKRIDVTFEDAREPGAKQRKWRPVAAVIEFTDFEGCPPSAVDFCATARITKAEFRAAAAA